MKTYRKRVLVRKVYAYECGECGDVFAELDRQYVNEWPSSSGEHLDKLLAEHRDTECLATPDAEVLVIG